MAHKHYGVKRRAVQLCDHFGNLENVWVIEGGSTGGIMVTLSLPHPIITKSVPRNCHAGIFEYCPHFRRQGQILVVVTALYPWSCFTDVSGIWEWDPYPLTVFSQLKIWWKVVLCWESATKCEKCNSSAAVEMCIYIVLGVLKSPGKFNRGTASFYQTMWYKQSNTSNPLVLQHSIL